MDKDRLGAFMDAILAIVMTILVLELEKPSEPSFAALWELRSAFAAYAVSFFGLGAMWVRLHRQWSLITQIDGKIVWCSIVLMFFSSLFPYVTSYVSSHFSSFFAQGMYCLVVLLVTITNMILMKFLCMANKDNEEFHSSIGSDFKRMWLNIAICVLAFIVALLIYSPIAMFGIIIAIIVSSIPLFGRRQRRESRDAG